ncbi:CoA transferase [Rhodococcus koreensis]
MGDVPSAGPLVGLRVVELAGIGPSPHAALVLADLGADVVRVERPSGRALQIGDPGAVDFAPRRRSVAADLKSEEGQEVVLTLGSRADVLIEAMRHRCASRDGP